MRDEELAEMVALLRDLGYDGEQAKRLTDLYASKEETFISIMMLMELGLVVNHVEAWKIGCINFSSFLLVSLLPLLPFMLSPASSESPVRLLVAVGVGGVQLFGLGYVKGEVIRASSERKRQSGVEVLVFGVVVVIIGYVVGNIFES
jgi:VIT1/CCC1 family predicted Fe2+/Mn2+ transporter